MQYLNTAAADIAAFLVEVRDFLSSNGWTILADNTGAGTPALEVTNANGHDFKLSTGVDAQTLYGVGAFNDRYLSLSYQKSDIGAAAGYSTISKTNDMAGPYANIWLFTDDAATFCNIVIQSSNYRYSHASFGNLDPKDCHAENLPYTAGNLYRWWRHSATLSANGHHDPSSIAYHGIGYFGDATYCRIGLPDGLLDPALDFTDGPIDGPTVWHTSSRDTQRIVTSTAARLLDYFKTIANHSFTGAIPLSPLPIIVGGDNSVRAYVGDIPGVCLVDVTGLSPGQILTFATDEWVVFPLKQFGLDVNAHGGASPQDVCNSTNYGFAYRKVD